MNSLNIFLNILIVIFSVIVVLTIHEFGHFTFAKIFRVNVKEFSIGFGPVLFKTFTKKTNIQVSLRLLPLGAYVLMDSASIRKAYLDEPNAKKYNFYLRARPHKTKLLEQIAYWQQMLILFGGIFFNLIFFAFFFGIGQAISIVNNDFLLSSLQNIFIQIGRSFVLYSLWPMQGSMGGGGGHAPGSFFQSPPNSLILLSWLLSINFSTAIVNLIPIAPLDGWKIMQTSYEKITKKTLPEKLLVILSITGLILVFWVTLGGIINQIRSNS